MGQIDRGGERNIEREGGEREKEREREREMFTFRSNAASYRISRINTFRIKTERTNNVSIFFYYLSKHLVNYRLETRINCVPYNIPCCSYYLLSSSPLVGASGYTSCCGPTSQIELFFIPFNNNRSSRHI